MADGSTRVLITGMSGLIGGLLRRRLEATGGYELRALNRRPMEGVDTVQADIADLEAIAPAFEGQEVVVHLAAQLQDDPWDELLRANVVGTYNVFEAARMAGCAGWSSPAAAASCRGPSSRRPSTRWWRGGTTTFRRRGRW